MKHCPSCKIDFNTKDKYCPLCQNKLVGTQNNNVFPSNIKIKTNRLILQILLFISLIIVVLSGFIELYTSKNLYYTLFIFGGLVTNYIIIYFLVNNNNNILTLFEKYGILLVIITLFWYLITKNVLIINYLIPLLCLFELIFNVITSIVLKRNYLIDSLRLIIINTCLLFFPVIFVLFGFTSSNLLSYICFVLGLIASIGLLIFFFDDIKEELEKMFNL